MTDTVETTTTTTGSNIVRLPLPARLEPKNTSRALMSGVRVYFNPLFNNDEDFRKYLASVGNKDSITLNRMFDRGKAVEIIKAAAKKAGDKFVEKSPEGKIYQCMVHIMREGGMGLKLRRAAYLQLTHQQAAE